MARSRKFMLIALALIAVIAVVVALTAPSIQSALFYPKPRGLPRVVSQTTDQLLHHLQFVLESNAPPVVRALQPGLSDSRIQTLEAEGGFHLSEDLRALYRWHDGNSTNSLIGIFGGQRFVPLDEVVRERALMCPPASASGAQRAAFSIFAGHRKSWLHLFDDGAGDGYFYDPTRKDAEGAFFYHFSEDGDYLWFPSLRNFLAGAIECYESRAIKVATDGRSLEEDFERTRKVWERLGKSRDSAN